MYDTALLLRESIVEQFTFIVTNLASHLISAVIGTFIIEKCKWLYAASNVSQQCAYCTY